MNRQIESVLKELGLNDTEIKCYLGLLKFGTTNASALSKRLGIPRSTARHTLEQLAKKDLAIHSRKNGAFFFIPEEPERILRLVNKEQELLKKKQERAKSIVSELQAMMNPQVVLPKVEFFEGKEGVKKAFTGVIEALETGETILSITNSLPENVDAIHFLQTIEEFETARIAKKISIKTLCVKGCSKAKKVREREEVREIDNKKIPFDTQQFGAETMIFGSHMRSFFVNQSDCFAFSVTHAEIVGLHRYLFESLWEKSSSINK